MLTTLATIAGGTLTRYRREVLAGRAPGLQPIVLGLAGRQLGIGRRETVLLLLHLSRRRLPGGRPPPAGRRRRRDPAHPPRPRPDAADSGRRGARVPWKEMYACAVQTELMTMIHETATMTAVRELERRHSVLRTGRCGIGIGGPVGLGKTALVEQLVPRLLARGIETVVVTNDIVTTEDAEHVRRTLAGILDADRIVGVETGSCPHTAVREDPTMNLAALEALGSAVPDRRRSPWSRAAATT